MISGGSQRRNISSPNPTPSTSRGAGHRNLPDGRHEFMLKRRLWRFGHKNNWRRIRHCLICGKTQPRWEDRMAVVLLICDDCAEDLDQKKYAE